MRFQIELRTTMNDYVLNVDQVNVTSRSEDFIINNNDSTKTVTIRSNRPFLRSKPGTKRWKPKYEVIESTRPIVYKNYLDDAFIEIMRHLEPELYPKPARAYTNPDPEENKSERGSRKAFKEEIPYMEKRKNK